MSHTTLGFQLNPMCPRKQIIEASICFSPPRFVFVRLFLPNTPLLCPPPNPLYWAQAANDPHTALLLKISKFHSRQVLHNFWTTKFPRTSVFFLPLIMLGPRRRSNSLLAKTIPCSQRKGLKSGF